jgi:hypothetical protein
MSSMAGDKHPIADALRRALDATPSRYQVSQATGVDQAVLSRFARGIADLKLSTADALADYFGLELHPRRRHTKRTSR